jgi:hypothetical protein
MAWYLINKAQGQLCPYHVKCEKIVAIEKKIAHEILTDLPALRPIAYKKGFLECHLFVCVYVCLSSHLPVDDFYSNRYLPVFPL